jgi:mRNA interferase MazF
VPSQINPELGEIWIVNFDPQVGREQSGRRPALVVSNNVFNKTPHGLCMVVPLTGTDRGIAVHIRVERGIAGLTKTSFILCEQVRSHSLDRFIQKWGDAPEHIVKEVQFIVGKFIDRENPLFNR